ncbi:dTDP-4-dehydrorhamnose reductase [Kwoniella shivajii]|uniref:dTDP-4-dehydrorhamnose reductase n=1 Tax=Kwoniella shivajii TaxID=564305 RepID=A0ABZ1CZT3_9TREE|nr:dTDP-4-dehydrorhamnose reductase [Kwoniella shivajii]
MVKTTVVITGASGLLGRAVTAEFESSGDEVIKLANSRAGKDSSYTKLDLMDEEAVNGFFQTHGKIDGAAERRPDVAEADPEKAAKINAVVPAHLAALANQRKFLLFYISTDYVFNGKNPPYDVDASPDPLQMYGRQKLDGEKAVLAEREKGAKVTVLRVPILYGKTEYNAESAVNILRDVVQDQSGKQYKMDAYQVRFPTNVEDIGRVLYDLSHVDKPLPPILHYATPSPALTKYDMTTIISKHLSLPIDHVIRDTNKPGPEATPRPENTQLSTKALEELGIDVSERKTFDEWWKSYIGEK